MINDTTMIKWFLVELSNADASDIESNDMEIYGEDEQGREGSFTIEITKIAERSLRLIEQQQSQTEKLNKVVEAAKTACFKSWVINGGLTVACVDDLKSALAELEPQEATK